MTEYSITAVLCTTTPGLVHSQQLSQSLARQTALPATVGRAMTSAALAWEAAKHSVGGAPTRMSQTAWKVTVRGPILDTTALQVIGTLDKDHANNIRPPHSFSSMK